MPDSPLIIELRAIKDRVDEAAQFLKSKIEGKIRSKGTQLHIDGAKTKDVKLLIHKFLHHQGLNNYRVHSQAGILEILPPEEHIVHEVRPETTPPSAYQTVPYYFPQSTILKSEKKLKKKI